MIDDRKDQSEETPAVDKETVRDLHPKEDEDIRGASTASSGSRAASNVNEPVELDEDAPTLRELTAD